MSRILLKTIISHFILSLMFIQIAHAAPVITDKNKVEINIGIYAPFSNKHAFVGRNMLGAMEMAQEQLKASHVHYSFYTLDKLPDNVNPTNTLQKFIKARQLNVLLTEGSVNGAQLAALAKKNNIIHFSMASDPAIADGKNNFLVWSPVYENAAVLVKTHKVEQFITQYQDTNWSYPVTEAGYSYDAFQILNQSVNMALKVKNNLSTEELAKQIHTLALGTGIMGAFNLDKHGVLYAKAAVKIANEKVETA